jgi:hypothetical protein
MLCGFGIFVNHAKDFVMLYLATFCNLFFFFFPCCCYILFDE